MKVVNIKNNCSLPFTGMQIDTDGRISPCCMYKNAFDPEHKIYKIHEYDEYWNFEAPRIQKSFLDGNYAKGCNTCFDSENDITSGLRINATENFLSHYNEFSKTNSPEWLDIRFGNYCNLKCLMCHPDLSSQIYLEQHQNIDKFKSIGIDPISFTPYIWWEKPELLETVFNLSKKAKFISFSGGEPLLAKQFNEILKHTDPDCIISINTNLTKLTDQHLNILQKFKDVKINVSLDGIGAHHEYIRHGSNWTVIEENIHKILKYNNIEVIFTYLLQHTSIYTFPNFYNYIKQFNKEVSISTVYSQSVGGNHMMTLNSVIPTDVRKFQEWSKNLTSFQDIITQWLDMYEFDQDAHNKFKSYVFLLDEIRGCNFRETFGPSW